MGTGFNLNILDQFAFYGAYHNNFYNQVIHVIFVPIIIATILVFLNYAPPLHQTLPHSTQLQLPAPLDRYVELNNGLYVVLVYLLFYLKLEPFAGATWFLTHGLGAYFVATWLHHSNQWPLAVGLHLLAWYMQIHPGHAILERRKPALMDSLIQAFAMAPLFVHMEVLFWLGYRPNLRARIDQEVARRIALMDGSDLPKPLMDGSDGAAGVAGARAVPASPPTPQPCHLRHDHGVTFTP